MRHTHPAREVAHKGIKNLKNPKTNYIYSQLDFYDEAEGSHKLLRSIKTKSSLWKISTQNLCKRSSLSYPSVPVMTLMQMPFSLSRTHTHMIIFFSHTCGLHSLTHLLSWESAKPLMMSFVSPNQPTPNPIYPFHKSCNH